MQLKKLVLIVVIFLSSTITAQNYEITKIIETNLFELENGQKVKFYGLSIPSQTDSNKNLSKFANKILKWEKEYFLGRDFEFEFIKSDENKIAEVNVYKSYSFGRKNIANELLSSGYATLKVETDKDYALQLISSQKRASKAKVGLWKYDQTSMDIFDISKFQIDKNYSHTLLKPKTKRFERPYLPFLALSAASFAMSWDSFSSYEDIQDIIDAQKELDHNIDTSALESAQTRKVVVGVSFLVTGIVTTIFAFKTIEVKTDFQAINLSYRF